MIAQARQEAGFTLVELLIVSTLFVVLLGATLDIFMGFERNNRRVNDHNAQIETARESMDNLSRQLRNLARPDSNPTTFLTSPSIRAAEPYNFVFQTSDPTKVFVRYCLAVSGSFDGSPITLQNSWLFQVISASGTLPSSFRGACPGTNSATNKIVGATRNVVNRVNGQNRPVFTYMCLNNAPSCTNPQLDGARAELYVDTDPTRAPAEDLVSSAVYLRNQNQPPVAEASIQYIPATATFPNGQIQLNGSRSSDPEGRTLEYYWFRGALPSTFSCQNPPVPTAGEQNPTLLATVTATFPAQRGTNTFNLIVCDPGYLADTPPNNPLTLFVP